MNILSIDWDFFFPDTQQFDWQMNEDQPFYYELIWPIRWANSALFKPEVKAKRIMHPNVSQLHFLEKIEKQIPKFHCLALTDSHKDLYTILEEVNTTFRVWNFDQHHDCGYGKRDHDLNCGNWAQVLRREEKLEQFTQIYPEWRRTLPEEDGPNWADIRYEGEEIDLPERFDVVFICRSSPWTPSWSDHIWLRFINWFKTERPRSWETKVSLPYALTNRKFSFKQACNYNKQFEKSKKGSGVCPVIK